MPNPNHPPKNSVIRVEPIRDLKAIKRIKKLLEDRPRDLAIFVIGCNTNMRASTLAALTVGMVKDVPIGGSFTIRETKTNKTRTITVNKVVHEAIAGLLKYLGEDAKNDDFLFASRKGKGRLTTPTMTALIKGWCSSVGLRGNYGSHSLRKTFGYIHRTIHNTDLPTLCHMFNHSTQRQTLGYLGIEEQEIVDAYLREI